MTKLAMIDLSELMLMLAVFAAILLHCELCGTVSFR